MATPQNLSKDEKLAKDFISLAFKEHEGQWMTTANRLNDFFSGRYYTKTEKRSRFTVNSMFSIVNLLLPNFIFNQPYIRVKAEQAKYYKKLSDGEYRQIDSIRAAQIREASINWRYKKIGAIYEQRKAVQDAFFYGFGITKVGYSYETIASEDKDYVVKDSEFLKRVNPKNFGWHPLASGLDDSPMLVERILTTKDRLKKSGRFSGIDELEPEIPQFLKDKLQKNDGMIKDYGYISLYEVHGLEKNKIYYFGGEEKKLLDKIDNPYNFDGSHFQMIKFSGNNDDFLGIPLLEMVEDEAIALNEVMTLVVEHFRKFPGMLFYEEGSIDDDAVERIRTGEQGSIHNVNNIDKLKLQNPLTMGGEYFSIVNLLNNMMDRILGIPDFQRANQVKEKTATEASFIHGDATVRREYFLQLVKDFMLDGIKKLADLQSQFQDETVEIQASGDLTGMQFKFDKSDIQGDFLFDFDLDSLRALNELQANNLNALLNILGAHEILHPILKSLSSTKLGKQLFKKFGLEIDSFLPQGSETNSVFIMPEKENEIARSGKPMPNPKDGEDHEFHLRVHGQDLQQKGPNNQILDHMAATMMLLQQQEMGPPQPDQMQQPDQPGGVPGQPPGPIGPMQMPPTGAPPTMPPQ